MTKSRYRSLLAIVIAGAMAQYPIALTIIAPQTNASQTDTPTITIEWRAAGLTNLQRTWIEGLANDASSLTAPGTALEIQIAKLRRHAAAARRLGLVATGRYLEKICDAAAGGDPVAAEQSFKATVPAPVVVLVRLQKPDLGASPFSDVMIGVRDANDVWLQTLESRLEEFARTVPGYSPTWQRSDTPRGVSFIGNLVLRGGASAQSTAPATYPPFDAALRPRTGRSWIHWRNMMRANWFEREIRPTGLAALAPAVARSAAADAHLRWYAIRFAMYDIGPEIVRGEPIAKLLGETRDPLEIAKADSLAILADQWLADQKVIARPPLAEELSTLAAVTFHTLNDVIKGTAPPQHRGATCLLLNWCIRNGGLLPGEGGWNLNTAKMFASLQSLTREILEIETSANQERAAKLLAQYGSVTPPIQAALDRLPPPHGPKARVVYRIIFSEQPNS
jgi:hypothetical protein